LYKGDVLFLPGIDRRDDIDSPNRFDVYYGMADNRIGVACLDVPDVLALGGLADPQEGEAGSPESDRSGKAGITVAR
jgi:hypothetical protein